MSRSIYSRAGKNLDKRMAAYKRNPSRRKWKAFRRALHKWSTLKRASKRR